MSYRIEEGPISMEFLAFMDRRIGLRIEFGLHI